MGAFLMSCSLHLDQAEPTHGLAAGSAESHPSAITHHLKKACSKPLRGSPWFSWDLKQGTLVSWAILPVELS